MTGAVSDIAFTPVVKAEQARRGWRAGYAGMAGKGDWSDTVDDVPGMIRDSLERRGIDLTESSAQFTGRATSPSAAA